MKKTNQLLIGLLLASVGSVAFAAGADLGQAEKQATNWTAIGMFVGFVILTMFITKWAAGLAAAINAARGGG